MNRIILFLITLLISTTLWSQNIAVKSFKPLANDLDARITFQKKDQNGDVCAIIKVVTSETGFTWDGDALGITEVVKKTGEFWLYVPYGAKRLTIKHDKLGILRDYIYPERIEKATVYEMVLSTGKVITTVVDEEIKTIWLTFKSMPEAADIYINDVLKGVTPMPIKLTSGKYTYRLEKAMYHIEAGAIEITGDEPDGKKEVNISFNPAFGFVKINTTPENGATVLVDDIEVNSKTPYVSEKLKSGKHKVTVKKEMFQPKTVEVFVIDGQTVEETITLFPNFANIIVSTQPEADIYIDGHMTATGNYKGRILTGIHSFEGKKNKHFPDIKNKEVQAGEDVIINLILQPKQGSIDIVSNPIEAIVYINSEKKGITPLTLKKVLIGDYELKLEKQGYGTINKTITVSEDKTTELNEILPDGKTIKIMCNDDEAKLFIDGKSFGIFPQTITLSFGEHTLSAIKNGCFEILQTITVNQSTGNITLDAGCIVYRSMTDQRDGEKYKYIKIGNQNWMAENLNFNAKGSWCYDDKINNCEIYGRLYDWEIAKKVCPSGWHLPSDNEWSQLTDYLGGESVAGGKMKEKGTVHWNSPNIGADNSSGFSALPSGVRSDGIYYGIGNYGDWWRSDSSPFNAYYRHVYNISSSVVRNYSDRNYNLSVRCIMDN